MNMEKKVLNNNENNDNHEKRSKKSLSELETVRTFANFSTTNLIYATAGITAFTNLIVHVLPNAHKADGENAGDEVNKSFWS